MQADGLGEVIADLVAATMLLDIGPVVFALVLCFGGLAPPLIQLHGVSPLMYSAPTLMAAVSSWRKHRENLDYKVCTPRANSEVIALFDAAVVLVK